MKARDYQLAAERRVIAYAVGNPTGRALVVIPTRGGKTFVGARLALRMGYRLGLRVLWLAHREELLDEAVAHLVGVGIPVGKIGMMKRGRSSDPSAPIQVASEQTLLRREFPPAHLVISDESHRDTSPSRRKIRKAYPKAFLIGLTATPKPPPARDLGEDYDTLMLVVQPSELIHDGWLEAPTVFAPEPEDLPELRGVRRRAGDYAVDELAPLLMRRELIDQQIAEWARLHDGRSTMTFAVTCEHSQAVTARFKAHGINAAHLDGDTGSVARAATLTGLNAGTLPVVCSVGVLSEGTNVPRVKLVFSLRPTFSLTLYIQLSMRCATPWGGVKPRILDGAGNVYWHGYPFADRKWSLVNEESGNLVNPAEGTLRRCRCGAVLLGDAKRCPSCKAVLPPPPAVEMPDKAFSLIEVAPPKKELSLEHKRLIEFAQQRGFTDPECWAQTVLRAKHGTAAETA